MWVSNISKRRYTGNVGLAGIGVCDPVLIRRRAMILGDERAKDLTIVDCKKAMPDFGLSLI